VWLLGAAVCGLAIAGTQLESVVAKNVALATELSKERAEIVALRAREVRQSQTIARLGTAEGSIPEIHDKLRYVGPHEELFYVRGLPVPSPAPAAGEGP
jgi:hypothetical protein